MADSIVDELEVMRIDFEADAGASPPHRSETCRTGSEERIEHRVADEAEHANEAFGQFQREGSRMMLR